jgi:hypothetical protein
VYILEDIPPPPGTGILADVIRGKKKNMKKGVEKKRKKCEEKRRKDTRKRGN